MSASLFPENASLLSAAQAKVAGFFQNDSYYATVGPYTLDWATQQYKCWISQWITFALLMALQLVNIFWFYLILKILWRLAMSSQLDDVRSEDGDTEEEVMEKKEFLNELRTEQGIIDEALAKPMSAGALPSANLV